jgi:hypothetical protein
MANAPNAILAISSTDRYITTVKGNANQPFSNVLLGEYLSQGPYANDFSITAPSALINGYIEKIIVSQIQLQYNVPTVIPYLNDTLPVYYESGIGTGLWLFKKVEFPYGFYTPQALAAIVETQLAFDIPAMIPWTVGYFGDTGLDQGFKITTGSERRFYLGSPAQLRGFGDLTEPEITAALKTYRMFGYSQFNSEPSLFQLSWNTPQLLYTPFIDIYSDALTNYQALKDTDSSVSRRKGLVARLYLSGVGAPQVTNRSYIDQTTGNTVLPSDSLGAYPFTLTFDLNSPKVINWTKDTAVNSLDFQVRDCYGDLLFSVVPPLSPGNPVEQWNSEFQITLLCIEGD